MFCIGGALGLIWAKRNDGFLRLGNIQLLGVASYAAPLLSTFVLIGSGHRKRDMGVADNCPADHSRRSTGGVRQCYKVKGYTLVCETRNLFL